MGTARYQIGRLGLKVDSKITFREYGKLGKIVASTVKVGPWLLGDWVNFGEQRFGEKYSQAVSETGLSPERLRVCAWVANRYPERRRREELSFEVHRELAYVKDDDEQDRLLQMAVDEGMDSKEIREWKKQLRGGEEANNHTPLYKVTLEWEDSFEEDEFQDFVDSVRAFFFEEWGMTVAKVSRPE